MPEASETGSIARIIAAAGTVDIATAGPHVVDHVVINDASLATDLGVSIQDIAGVEEHGWDAVDTTSVDYKVHGLSCGPRGIQPKSGKGLRIVVTATLAFEITVLYRPI